jgi:ATP-dependent helicase HrpA
MPAERLNELRELLPNCLRQDRLRLEARLQDLLAPGRRPALEGQLDRLLGEARKSVGLRHRRHERLPPLSYPAALPITAKKDEIVAAIKAHQVVIIAGETGSGKTTQLPKMCLEAGFGIEGKVGCTQPRRVAALSISRRIAEELRVTWGREVGCKIRFSDQSAPETYIKMMTDGILLAETQGDRDLHEYEAIMVDEAHERSLNIDFLLGHLKLLLGRRPELKLIISSATIDTAAYAKAFAAPVIEVSGRLYPVEVRYAPLDPTAEESGDLTYIDAAVNAVDALVGEAPGDILVFMPGERDIRETKDDLAGRYGNQAEIIPLYGRLTSGEQERVFAAYPRRKIIIATNIAETALTLPGIRYVIDTGLARISRYSPRTRTRRLPIEPISQASANQRAGRCGRVASGVCVRLYAEADYAERPRFTQPEIQRANLAEVILRLKAWRLGEIENFPFLDPPQPQAINRGYELLQELGALDADRNLTPLGQDLARLPVDPAIGRMVLQSVRERALEEVLVIAAGLSIQDPRERPLDRPDAADQAHRQFADPDSDFLSLLKIWNAFHEQWEACQTQNQLRKFCKANFLSYIRMREWVDIHTQLEEALREVLRFSPEHRAARSMLHAPRSTPVSQLSTLNSQLSYASIHRSILTGLLGHIAQREERNLYKAPGNRQVMAFPGSALFDRNDKAPNGKRAPAGPKTGPKSHQSVWIVAGEIVETSRLFARTLARINPEWIVELGAHLCKRSYAEPQWNREAGRVLVRERVSLLGLEIQDRLVDYGNVDPAEATEIFIRSALIEEDLEPPPGFLQHNCQLRQKLEVWRTRTRNHKLPDLDEALFAFYSLRLKEVSSVHDLNRLLRENVKANPGFLYATEAELAGQDLAWEAAGFPAEVRVADQDVGLDYAYAPGEEHDGITVKLPVALAPLVQPGMLDWLVPGLREEQVEFLLKQLPKAIRVSLMPLAPKVKDLAAALSPSDGLDALCQLVRQKYGVQVPATAWTRELLPDYLRVRVAITGKDQQVLAAGRDLEGLKQGLARHDTPAEHQAWARAVQQWERYALAHWTFGDVPERVEVTAVAGVPLYAFPGLEADPEAAVHLKLFRRQEEAEAASRGGFVRMVELALQRELAWLQKDLRALDKVKDLYLTLGPAEELFASAYTHLKNHLIPVPAVALPLKQAVFEAAVAAAQARLAGLVPPLVDRVSALLRARHELLLCPKPYPNLRRDLDALIPKRFLESIPFERLPHVPRYLKALQVRAERAALNGAKDQEKARQIQPFLEALQKLQGRPFPSEPARRAGEAFRWMLEEFKVSVFAQELGTAQPVSAKRLSAQLEGMRSI